MDPDASPRHPNPRLARSHGLLALAVGALAGFGLVGAAWAEPPVQSAHDAHCRGHARAHVFSVPDPQNLGLHEVGRRLYMQCMGRGPGGRRRAGRSRRR